jgi:hypothetical protein
MNQSSQIKPTLINGEDANPKAVENRLAEEANMWDHLGQPTWGGVDQPGWLPGGPPFGGSSFRVF